MRRFLRLLGNLGIMILAFIAYALVQGLYVVPAKMKITPWHGLIIALITVLVIWGMFWVYKYQLSKENDWFFNAKPHWSGRRILIAFGAFFLIMIAQVCFIKLWGTHVTSDNQAALEAIQSKANPIFDLLIVIVAPICEEIIFRGMFFNTFFPNENKTAKIAGIISSGFIFALCHDPNLSKFIFLYWVMGSVLAWTYVTTKDLRYSILAHMLNNLMGVL
ncbi:type II CAAX endopeptidase family protein [uncultured Lactobacillus sp.]|uniref:type II CAAX endopeptidase family protein n=1 Tax=uncultured Lactobacillus sp. TaxID=153152 RepID=UPI002610AEAC|nr:type II CAAX endopeptidase family protein [uncultured Lactobacillus sp.]